MIHQPFASRADAGRLLAEAFAARQLEQPLVIAVDGAAAPVARALAAAFGQDARASLVGELRLPWAPNLVFGAITEDNHHYLDPEVVSDHGLGAREIGQIARGVLAELRRSGARPVRPTSTSPDGTGDRLTTIIVSEGLSTGYRTLAVVASARAGGATQVIVATPCAARDALDRVQKQVPVVALHVSDRPRFFPPECYASREEAVDAATR